MTRSRRRRGYGGEFLTMFIAVVSAFALNNWNDNRKDRQAESKILAEISNGLEKDLEDVHVNMKGHRSGLIACTFWTKVLEGDSVRMDSLYRYYLHLTRDFVTIQNRAGYETLKSKGLELIENDSLRLDIIDLYEYDYNTLHKLEEKYFEMQFQQNYFLDLNRLIAPHMVFDSLGSPVSVSSPLPLSEVDQKFLRSYLWKIRVNRSFILGYYDTLEKRIEEVRKEIEQELDQ